MRPHARLLDVDPFEFPCSTGVQLVQSLALLSAKIGKNRLKSLVHPLPRALLDFRMQAEGLIPLSHQDGESRLLKALVGGRNLSDPAAFHDLHADAVGHAPVLVVVATIASLGGEQD